MVVSMVLVSAGRHWGLQWRFCTMVQWMATQYMGRFSNFRMAQWDIPANTCQGTCRDSGTWLGWRIKRGPPSGTRQKWYCTPQCSSSTKGGAILSSYWPSSSFEVVANQVFCGSCGYIPHVCRNRQWSMHRNAAQIPGFTKSLCIRNHSHSGRDRLKSYSTKPCSNNSEVLGIEWAVAGICISYPTRGKQSTRYMVTKYGTWWLW